MSNLSRWAGVVGVGALAAGSLIAPPAVAAQSDAQPRAHAEAMSDYRLPTKKLNRTRPRVVDQPQLVKNPSYSKNMLGKKAKRYALVGTIKLFPWHTKDKHKQSQTDRVALDLDVSKKSTKIRYVGLSEESRSKGLKLSKKLQAQSVKKRGTYQFVIPVSKKTGKSLHKQSVSKQRDRVRVTVRHRKDVRSVVPGRDFTQIAQTGKLQEKWSKNGKGRVSAQGSGSSVTVNVYLFNYTPFAGEYSFQGTQCTSDTSVSGSFNNYNDSVMITMQEYNSGSSALNSQGTVQDLSSDTVNALTTSAQEAGTNANVAGSALYTPAGAVSEAAGWATGFLIAFIGEVKENSCSDQPVLYTESFAPTAIASSDGSGASGGSAWDYNSGTGSNFIFPIAASPLPTQEMITSTLGAQMSTQWHWNDNDPQPSGPGSFNWSGGLISASGMDDSYTNKDGVVDLYATDVGYYFVNDGSNTTGMGPSPQVWPPQNGLPGSPGFTTSWDDDNVRLACTPGSWQLSNPWGDSIALNPAPNGNEYTADQGFVDFTFNGTQTVKGETVNVYNESIPGVEPIEEFGDTTQYQTVTTDALETLESDGYTVDEWVCSLSSALQVQSWAVPPGWPADLGSTPNGTWTSAPNVVMTSPFTPPSSATSPPTN